MAVDKAKMGPDFQQNAHRFGLRAEDLGRTFVWGGRSLTLVGYDPKERREPFVGRDAYGCHLYFSLADVQGGLQPQVVA